MECSEHSIYIEGMVFPAYFLGEAGCFLTDLQVIDRKAKLTIDGRFQTSIIRPTSGAVETENSLRFNELYGFR
ncbi:hypothetical protein C0J26_00755 [Pseudomonas baetica]|nr:hypothetical protein C0J26_00755 [Pseudomonas baetica]